MIRVTTNSTLYTYKNNLYQNTNQLYSAMTKLMTQRNFSSYSSNPAAATRAFKIHSSLNATNAQYQNNTTALNKYSTAWDIVDQVYDKLSTDLGQVPGLSGLNDPASSTLQTQAQILRAGAETIIQNMNGKYDDDFIFNGNETKEPPFAIVDDVTQNPPIKVVTYRGIRVDVDSESTAQYLDPETGRPVNANMEPIPDGEDTTGALTNAQVYEKLEAMNNETHYIDVGLGFTMGADGKVVDSTAFDYAISGIEILGFGVDEDGDPQNLASIMLRLADMFDSYDVDSKTWGVGSYDQASDLYGKFTAAQEALSNQHVSALDTQATFLKTNQTRLEQTYDALNTERADIEDIDQVDAITELVWAQTCYNAALQVGANVIPQSLMDYMN